MPDWDAAFEQELNEVFVLTYSTDLATHRCTCGWIHVGGHYTAMLAVLDHYDTAHPGWETAS
jgi:hypothetical protein